MHEIVRELTRSTKEYEKTYNKQFRKEKCQFFTPITIAHYMSKLFNFSDKRELRILDPAGGTGILSLILLLRILTNTNAQNVILDIYEIDNIILKILENNIILIKQEYKKANRDLEVNIYNVNFITDFEKKEYDIIIGNPPYKKIRKNTAEAQVINDLLFGQPNLYMIFMTQSLRLLKKDGEMVFIVPRSFFNGKYFSKFRKWLYNNYSITYIHSFESRSKIINDEVLQELVVIKIVKSSIKEVLINHSINDKDIENNIAFHLSSTLIWDKGDTKNIRLPVNSGDIELLKIFNNIDQTIQDLNFAFKTGPVVDFRVKKGLYNKKYADCVPLIWCANFGSYRIEWPLSASKFKQYISLRYNQNILLPMENYILIKRFSSKEEGKNINVNILLKEDIECDYLGIENHVNYLMFNDENKEMLKGIFILLNSNYYNRYFKIINGTTQINATDLNTLPIFSDELLRKLSSTNLAFNELTSEMCDNIIRKHLTSLCFS